MLVKAIRIAGLIAIVYAIAVFAHVENSIQMPTSIDGLRGLIGTNEKPKECQEVEEVRSCWSISSRAVIYSEQTSHFGWRVTCNLLVKPELAHRLCYINGQSVGIRFDLNDSSRNYKFYPGKGGRDLHADRPIYVTIDGIRYVSPEDSTYGELELETEEGKRLENGELIRMLGNANRITTVTWEPDDQETSKTDRGEGFIEAHDIAIEFLERIE